MSQADAVASKVGKKTQVTIPSYLYPNRRRSALPETPARKTARRRAEECGNKPRCGIVSIHAVAEWICREDQLILWGHKSKIVCPGKPNQCHIHAYRRDIPNGRIQYHCPLHRNHKKTSTIQPQWRTIHSAGWGQPFFCAAKNG